MKTLCDRCRREYEAESDAVEKYEKYKELICLDCQSDMDYSEEEERSVSFLQEFNSK